MSMRDHADTLTLMLLFLVSFAVFWFSPVHQLTDSNYSMLLSESLIHHQSVTLDDYAIPRFKPRWHDNTFKNGEMYQIELVGPHLYYYLPPGSSVLSIPYVLWMNAFGVSAARPDGRYNPDGEKRIESGLASLLMAGLCCIFFLTARLLLSRLWSLTIAAASAFGTQVWSTASRVLWSETWAIFLVGLSIYLLLSDAVGRRKLNPLTVGTLLVWSYIVRPTNAISLIAVGCYIVFLRRDHALKFAATVCCWLLIFVIYSWYHFHQFLPNYFLPGRLSFHSFESAFAGNLISPSRGLFIYVPALLVIVYLVITERILLNTRLAIVAVVVILAHLVIIAGFTPWNGGFCYGPRYTTGLVPWFSLISIFTVRSVFDSKKPVYNRRMIAAAALVLVCLSIFMNARGATSYDAWMWNVWPDSVDTSPEKIWDWTRPQFLAGLIAPPLPATLPVLQQRVLMGYREAEPLMRYGWSGGENNFRWSDGHEAAIAFANDATRDSSLAFKLGAFVISGKLNVQHVKVLLNGSPLAELVIDTEPAREYSYHIDHTLLKGRNTLVFRLPDAASPKSIGVSDDERRLAIRIEWIELLPSQSSKLMHEIPVVSWR